VDDTLVTTCNQDKPPEDAIQVSYELRGKKFKQWVRPMSRHIRAVIHRKDNGHPIIVWTGGGWEWGEAIVEALGLTKYVDVIMSKPCLYFDDLEVQEFMLPCTRIYLYKGKL